MYSLLEKHLISLIQQPLQLCIHRVCLPPRYIPLYSCRSHLLCIFLSRLRVCPCTSQVALGASLPKHRWHNGLVQDKANEVSWRSKNLAPHLASAAGGFGSGQGRGLQHLSPTTDVLTSATKFGCKGSRRRFILQLRHKMNSTALSRQEVRSHFHDSFISHLETRPSSNNTMRMTIMTKLKKWGTVAFPQNQTICGSEVYAAAYLWCNWKQ